MKKVEISTNSLIIYQAKSGAIELRRDIEKETVWATQAQMAQIFGVNSQAVTKHLKNIYQEGELRALGTCSKMEQVQTEGGRVVKRLVDVYNLDAIISVGYRISSKTGTKFRQWATKILHQYISDGFAINKNRIVKNYKQFLETVENIKQVLPLGALLDTKGVLELMTIFTDTWLSLDAYDKDTLSTSGVTKRRVQLTAERLRSELLVFKKKLLADGTATALFGQERQTDAVAGIVGNIMQSFGGKDVYSTVEEKAAHLLYFLVKNHPFVDGNKRSGAYAFVWFLRQAKILNMARLTPLALTAMTLLVAESNPRDKDKMIKIILTLLR